MLASYDPNHWAERVYHSGDAYRERPQESAEQRDIHVSASAHRSSRPIVMAATNK